MALSMYPVFLASPRGVAPVTESAKEDDSPAGTGHVVIGAGNDISRNTRPTRAGLKGLLPNPPKLILPTPIANIAPSITSNGDRFDGRLKASSTPVTNADRSGNVLPFFKTNLLIINSVAMHDITDIRVSVNAGMPK